MSHIPPERDDARGHAVDWNALLSGGQPASDDATGSSSLRSDRAGAPPPLTRREAREAEQRAASGRDATQRAEPRDTLVQTLSYDEARPSRSELRSAAPEYSDVERPRRSGAWGCLVAVLVLVALGVGGFFALQGPVSDFLARFEPAADYEGQGEGEVVFMINEGDGGETIAFNLASQDIVASAEAFNERLLAEEPTPTFYPGAYRLASKMSADAALTALLDPTRKLENTFVIQEGLWARDALAAASAATQIPIEELQAVAANPAALGLPPEATTVEGFLFPATYTFEPGVTAQEVVQTLVNRTFESLDAAGVAPEDRFRIVTIASLIERESGSEEDAYKVSRVIQNRLDPAQFDSGLLQFDSAVHYGLQDDTVVTTTDAERADTSNPYNTYAFPGLPPGPIGNPGDIAIRAALNPAEGSWLYFVTVNLDTGETVFSTTIDEHDAAVQRFLEFLDANPQYGG